jgi:hypothetical protein
MGIETRGNMKTAKQTASPGFIKWLLLSDYLATLRNSAFFVWFWRFFLTLCGAAILIQWFWFNSIGIGIVFGLMVLFMTLVFRFMVKILLKAVQATSNGS